jgi:hypothetical protein
LYGFTLLDGLFAGAGTTYKKPSWLRKFGMNCSSLFATVLKWPFFADQYGPRMASADFPKLDLNFPSLLQLLPLLLLPKHPLLLTCTT